MVLGWQKFNWLEKWQSSVPLTTEIAQHLLIISRKAKEYAQIHCTAKMHEY